jgi:large subunit ribosomal protein L2
MGKRIIQRRRGRGGPIYEVHDHVSKDSAKYMPLDVFEKGGIMQVLDFVSDPLHSAPLAVMLTEEFKKDYMIAPDGLGVGDLVAFGEDAEIKTGNTLPLGKIPEGTAVCNIETLPGDGGKLVRSSGSAAHVVSHDAERRRVIIKMPSKAKMELDQKCRATVGAVAGGGRKEKPFVKAGNKFMAMKLRAKGYPVTSAVAKNARDHPFGGRTKPGRQTSTSRNAPPGAKVGNIAPSRTGVRRTKKVEGAGS